mgnify:CR=1 FL=1
MRILGIDPGTATIGYGIIQTNGADSYKLINSGLVETAKELAHGQRLDLIYKGIADILTQHKPDVVAIERLFFATNMLTAMAVSQATGVIKLAVYHAGLPIFDYTPMQVKLVVGGSGKADKQKMKATIKKMFKIREKKGMRTHFDNTADALAIAVCHAKKTLNC